MMTPPAPPSVAPRSPADALDALLGHVLPTDTERVPRSASYGRILAEEIRADRDSPACDVSAMDGYALRIDDARRGAVPVALHALIGRPQVVLPAASAAHIVTGAPIPAGAEVVIKREDVLEHPTRIEIDPRVAASIKQGAAIRQRGENARAGQIVLTPGLRIGPPQAAALAAVGAANPLVHRRVRVGILVTGDELATHDARPEPYQLRDSNGPALVSLLSPLPFVDAHAAHHTADNLETTTHAIANAATDADVVFITGGVSMGDRDYVPHALRALNARVIFHKIPQRPGKPLLAAVLPSGTTVLALPGNPVSVLVTARRYGIPVIAARAGAARPSQPAPPAPRIMLDASADSVDLWCFRPVRLNPDGSATVVAGKGSGDMIAAGPTDGFIEVPPGASGPGPWPFYSWIC